MSQTQFELFLNKFSRYPTAAETEELNLGKFPSGKKSHQSSLRSNPDHKLFVDVTHTLDYALNSGIQRVVRSLVTGMRNNGYQFQLIKFDLDMQPVELTFHEMEKFYNWEKYSNSLSTKNILKADIAIRLIARFLKALIPNSLWVKIKLKYARINEAISAGNLLSSATTKKNILDLRKKHLLLPELVADESRINVVSILAKHYEVYISTILYDLIPVTHPEYCNIGYDFIHYLRIFRSAEKVFAISKHSENELKKLMAIIPREIKTPCTLKTILVGGDFPRSDAAKYAMNDHQKVILMVARFEPRKNIRRVLFVVKKLFEEKQNFKFVLVGNPGWLQNSILSDLKDMISMGYNIEYHLSISDSELISWYKKCYFSIFCSITEGFGLPIIESVLMGKPCITTHDGSQAEIAKTIGGCDLVDPYNLDDIYKKTKRLLTDVPHYQLLAQQASKAEWPTWSDYAKEIYKELGFT